MKLWTFKDKKMQKIIFHGDPKMLEPVLLLAQFSLKFLSGVLR